MEDPFEIALAEGRGVKVPDKNSEFGFHYEFPDVEIGPCPCPGEGRFDPYKPKP